MSNAPIPSDFTPEEDDLVNAPHPNAPDAPDDDADENPPAAAPGTDPADMPINTLVREIFAGRVRTDDLELDVRQRCVAHLVAEGFSTPEIMHYMRMSERTVTRDRAAARRESGVEPSIRLGDELLGEFQRLALAGIQRLTRLARDEKTPPYAKMWVEESIVRIHQRVVDTAHRLRYFEDGSSRLAWERENDPAEEQRRVARQRKNMRESLEYTSLLSSVQEEMNPIRPRKRKA